jgi:hypothetical protein
MMLRRNLETTSEITESISLNFTNYSDHDNFEINMSPYSKYKFSFLFQGFGLI